MSDVHSSERIKCMDYIKTQKKILYKTESVRLCTFGDLANETQGIVDPSIMLNKMIFCTLIIQCFLKRNFWHMNKNPRKT